MVSKFNKILPCKELANLLNNVLANRNIQVHLNEQSTRSYIVIDGLPQGSVLASVIFKMYTYDLPSTTCKKFIHVNDKALSCQTVDFTTGEHILNATRTVKNINKM